MTLPPFDLHRVASLDEAAALLDRYGEDAAVYCGGTELLLLLKLGFAAYGHLVDIKGIPELGGVRSGNGTLVVGATVTHRELERSPIVVERLPALAQMEQRVANIRVRSVGTLGGNLCFSDPHSDPSTFLLGLDAEIECGRNDGQTRRLPISDFVTGPFQTALTPGELLTAVHIPIPPPDAVLIHRKVSFHERPAATVSVLARVRDGAFAETRIAVGSIGPRPVRATEAERVLIGASPEDDVALAQAAELAAEAARPVADANGSADYKAQLARVLVERSLLEASTP